MIVYRITGQKYANDLTGLGAAMYGGRWNKKGVPVLYTGESKEIALLEMIVHTPPMLVPKLVILSIEIPDDSITSLAISILPDNWRSYPAPSILSEIGEKWVEASETIALKVPSCILDGASNYILNCRHPYYHKVKIIEMSDFRFDSRLIK